MCDKMGSVATTTQNSELKTQNRPQRSCGQCEGAVQVIGGRGDEWVCASYPDREGQLTLVASAEAGAGDVATRCRCFRARRWSKRTDELTADRMTRFISLAGGLFAIVDAADYEWLNRYRWHARGGPTGYASTTIDHRVVFMHRLIMNPAEGYVVDHKNGNRHDNRRSNLRECTQSENRQNSRKSRGTSRFKGVFWNTRRGKWSAVISCRGKTIYLGSFDDETEAARAYDRKARELFGAFACPNFPDDKRIVHLSGSTTVHSHARAQLTVTRGRPHGKSEIRISKSETNSNVRNPQPETPARTIRRFWSLSHLSFGHCFEFRTSCFGFPPWPRATGPPGAAATVL